MLDADKQRAAVRRQVRSASKRRLGRKRHTETPVWMTEPKTLRMQHESGKIASGAIGIEWIAQDGVTNLLHVNAKLMRSAGPGIKPDSALVSVRPHHLKVGDRRSTVFQVDHLAWAIWPVDGHWKINRSGLCLHPPPDTRDINLRDLPFLELKAQVALREGCQRKDHHSRSVPVQAMHKERCWKRGLNPAQQAVGKVLTLSRNR